tara:strand:+ start:246 stop:467 length:222 start_codon:yes stop_codon:yes gene_type:complete
MSELIEIYKNELEQLKIENNKLITKNNYLFKKNKNLKRNNMRLKKQLTTFSTPILIPDESIDDNWDYLYNLNK